QTTLRFDSNRLHFDSQLWFKFL
ncbi:hypothetical protein CCACVL1_29644, partial [Corchorus capsularis]